jgi:hypothetical protein
MGHGALRMGHGALRMGHGAWGMLPRPPTPLRGEVFLLLPAFLFLRWHSSLRLPGNDRGQQSQKSKIVGNWQLTVSQSRAYLRNSTVIYIRIFTDAAILNNLFIYTDVAFRADR